MMNLIQRLNDIFQYAYHNEHSDLYRTLYGGRVSPDTNIDSLETWRTLPYLTKQDLLDTPLLARTFTDPSDAEMLRTSSGTSGKAVLMTFRRHRWGHTDLFERFTPTGVLLISSLTYVQNSFREVFPAVPLVLGDTAHPETAIKLATGLPINMVGCWLYGYERLVPLLRRAGILPNIRAVQTFGERVSATQYRWLREQFPQAYIYTTYSASEMHDNQLGTSIDRFDSAFGTLFQVTSRDIYMELIDPDTGEVIEEENREGEIVVTMLWTDRNPSPLIRYRMGDLGMYVTYDPDPWQRTYTTRGRKDIDRLRISGGQLYAGEFERAIGRFDKLVAPDFELHYTEAALIGAAPMELWVLPRQPFAARDFAEKFMQEIRVAPRRTFADAVAAGLMRPLRCVSVRQLSREGKKRLRFVIDK